MAALNGNYSFPSPLRRPIVRPTRAIDPAKADAAARCIQRAWRRDISELALLKNPESIAALPTSQFTRFCQRVQPLLKSKKRGKSREYAQLNAAAFCRKFRELHQFKATIPVCSNLRPRGDRPPFQFYLPAEIAGKKLYRHGIVYLTEKAEAQFRKTPEESPKTLKDLDRLVSGLSEQTDLIPWDKTDRACNSRCHAAISILELCKVPLHRIRQQFVLVPEGLRKSKYFWNFHQAVLVSLPDGTSRVLDPSFSKRKALTLDDWIEFQVKGNAEYELVDLGHLQDKGDLDLTQKSNQVLVFTADPALQYCWGDKMGFIRDEDRLEDLQLLADGRIALEKSKIAFG